MWSFPFGGNKRQMTDITARHTLRVFMSLVFPWVCHSNHKVLWQNRAVALSLKHWTDLAWVSSLGMSSVAVRLSPLFQPGLLERFCGHCSRRRCPSLLVLLTYFIEVCKGLNRTELRFHQVFHLYFMLMQSSCKRLTNLAYKLVLAWHSSRVLNPSPRSPLVGKSILS